MVPAHIEDALAGVELVFNEVAAALESGEPAALVAASAAMRQAALDFAGLLQRLTPTDLNHQNLKARIKKLADGMVTQREGLIRRTVLVEMELNTVVPATRSATYAGASTPYGSAGKQTGAFKYLAA